MVDIRFPIITFDREKYIYYARNEDDLVICNNSSLNNGFYDNLLIIDITGAKYNVEGIKAHKVVGFNFFLQKKIKVDLILKKDNYISIEDFKVKILESYQKHYFFWESGGNIQETIKFIQNSKSIECIISKLCNEFYIEDW